MQSLINLILIAVLCWLVWSTWSVLRPNSILFSNGTFNSKSEKRHYAALTGFFLTLFAVIFVPTNWLLNLFLPEQWGNYDYDGEWTSFGTSISSFIAFGGSIGLIYRMYKKQLSLLHIGFWTNRFQPKEVKQCIVALEKIKPLFDKVLLADIVINLVKTEIVSKDGRKALLHSIRVAGNKPRDVVLLAIVNVSKSLLSSGQFHIYCGALNLQGGGIKSAFDIALRELVKSEFINETQATEQRSVVAKAIKNAG
jgi:hypothetical protein